MGIEHLHLKLEITHRDLRPNEILIMRDNKLVIAYFGASKETSETISTMKKERIFVAPEVFDLERREILEPFK